MKSSKPQPSGSPPVLFFSTHHKRMMNTQFVFCRYNPHACRVDGIPMPQFKRPFSAVYMYFDAVGSEPCISADPDHDESFKQLVEESTV